MGQKRAVASVVSALMIGAGMFTLVSPASADPPVEEKKVTICHETDSVTNPYVVLSVDADSVDLDTTNDQGNGDHNAEHNGPVFDPEHEYDPPIDDDDWGDIIPPFYEDGTPGPWPAKNWDETGQAIFAAGCSIPPPTTTTTSTTSTTSTTLPTTTTSSTSTSTTSTSTTSTSTTSTTIVGPSLFAFGAAGTECQVGVPFIVIEFQNTFPELAGEVGVLQMFAVSDESFVGEAEVIYEPGTTAQVLYPGAETDAEGNIIDLPGWNLVDGFWVADPTDEYLREGLFLEYTAGGETASAEVEYPPESSLCATPENPPNTTVPGETTTTRGTVVTANPPAPCCPPGSLPTTGSDLALSTVGGLGLIMGGIMLMMVRRRFDAPPQHLIEP